MSPRQVQTIARRPAACPLLRRSDWLARLEAAIAAARGQAFAWGRHDCCLFPCDAVRAMTGVDLAHGLRGRYRSLRGAVRLLQTRGGLEALAQGVAGRYQIPEVPPARARRGDVVLVDGSGALGGLRFALGPGGPVCLAIVDLTGAQALAAGADELIEVPMPFWRRAWRIG